MQPGLKFLFLDQTKITFYFPEANKTHGHILYFSCPMRDFEQTFSGYKETMPLIEHLELILLPYRTFDFSVIFFNFFCGDFISAYLMLLDTCVLINLQRMYYLSNCKIMYFSSE